MTRYRDADLTLVTLNLRNDLGWEQFLADLDAGLWGVDAAFLQEVQGRNLDKALEDMGRFGWRAYQGKGRGSAARQAILLSGRFKRAWMAVVLLHASRLFPSATRHLLKVAARDRTTGRRVRLTCVHFVPHADGGKRDPGGNVTTKPRRDLVLRSLRILAVWFRGPGIRVAAGDFNVDLYADLRRHDPHAPAETLERAGAVSPVTVLGPTAHRTHGLNMFDQFWVKAPKGTARMVAHRVLAKRFSDHRGYRLNLRLSARR